MADFIDEEEAQHLIRSVSPNPTNPVPSQPFSFLKLPREIRDEIYYYALRRPRSGRDVRPTHICYFDPKVPADAVYRKPYWGTHESTRLFFVNRQFSNEALVLFYSTYPFHFPRFFNVTIVNNLLRDTLSLWARSLITKVGFKYVLLSHPCRFTLRDEEKASQAIEAAMDQLPNVKQVILTLKPAGFNVAKYQVKEVVARALRIASPLRGFAGLSLGRIDFETAQQARIIGEVREALGCRWTGPL